MPGSFLSLDNQKVHGKSPFCRACARDLVTHSPDSPARGEGLELLILHELEARHALELALRAPAGARVVLALAFLAEVARLEKGAAGAGDLLHATLLDEGAADGALALLGRQILALPALAAEAGGEEIAQEIGFVAVARGIARIGDDADALEHARLVEQAAQHHRKIIDLGAGIFFDLGREIIGLRPIFQLVVIAKIDLAQAAR